MRPLESWLKKFIEPLELRCPRAQLDRIDRITGIVVLGGGLARSMEAVQLARRFPEARIILTGAGADEVAFFGKHVSSQSEFIVEPRARNTFENAVFAKRLAAPMPGEHWLVVTSALHMPRAFGTFTAQGFLAQPWPVYDTYRDQRAVAPVVLHELLGLLAYRLTGRTWSLLPCSRDDTA